MKIFYKISTLAILLALLVNVGHAQSFPQADPSVITITKQAPSDATPQGTNIVGTAILKFRVANNSAGIAANGKIPAGAVFYTVQFNPYYTYQSLLSTTQFHVTYSSGAPDYVVQLTNDVDINPGDVFDFYLSVAGLQPTTTPVGEIVTLNVDRTVPIKCANTQTANDNVSKSFTVSSAITLPVRKVDLSALLNSDKTIDVKWTTLEEHNTSSFVVERSADAVSFSAIGTKTARGNTSGSNDYSFLDNDIQFLSGQKVVYYRIKLVDMDGAFVYSKVVLVKLSKSAALAVWPNPFKDQLNFQVKAESKSSITINIYNSLGNLLQQKQQVINAGENSIALQTAAQLAKGYYYVEVLDGDKKLASFKLMKN